MNDWRWPTSSWDRRDLAVAAALAVLIAFSYSLGLSHPARPVFDEVLHVVSADEMLQGRHPSDVAHPPGARWLIALGLFLGPGAFDIVSHGWTAAHAFAWRLPSVLAAALSVSLVLLLGRQLGLGRLASLFPALLLAADGLFLVHARIGMTNAFSLAFILAAAAATWRALRRDQPSWLVLAGVFLGAAVATRWTGVIAVAALASAVLALRFPWTAGRSERPWEHWTAAGLVGFVLTPAAVYAAVFLPSVWPSGLAAWSLAGWSTAWENCLALHARMVTFHQYGVGVHPGHSAWWSWPLLQVPLWYYFAPETSQDRVTGIMALGNPMVWLAAVPAWALALHGAWRRGQAEAAFVGWLGLSLWGAWALTGRSTTFSTYFAEALPFAALAIALGLSRLPRAAPWMAGWLAMAAAWTAWTLPLLTAQPLQLEGYAQRMLLPRWEYMAQIKEFRQVEGLEGKVHYHRYLNGLGNKRWGLVSGPSPSPSPRVSPPAPRK